MEHPGPFLIDFAVEPEENVYPIVPPGAALCEQINIHIRLPGANEDRKTCTPACRQDA
jgi:hypothetical protein